MFFKDIEDVKNILTPLSESIVEIHKKLNMLFEEKQEINERLDEINYIIIDAKTRDRFDDYMKNVDKLNLMINEFKGCVSMARSVLEERKKLNENEEIKGEIADFLQEMRTEMLAFLTAWKIMAEEERKKLAKKKKAKAV